MSKLDEALVLHTQLLHACTDEVVSAVVQLHSPMVEASPLWVDCDGCEIGENAEGGVSWPCRTIRILNRYLHVDGVES